MKHLLASLQEAASALTEAKKPAANGQVAEAAEPGTNADQVARISDDQAMIGFNRILAAARSELTKSGFQVSWDEGNGIGPWAITIERMPQGQIESRRPEFSQFTVYAASGEDARKQFEKAKPGMEIHSIDLERPAYASINDKYREFTVNVVKASKTEETGAAGAGAGLPKPMGGPTDGPDDDTDEEPSDVDEAKLVARKNSMLESLRSWQALTINPRTKQSRHRVVAAAANEIRKAAAWTHEAAAEAAKGK